MKFKKGYGDGMLFQKKIDRAMNWLKEKDNIEKQTADPSDRSEKKGKDFLNQDVKEKLPLEKNDFAALVISALLVFAPILIVLVLIIILVTL